MILLGASNLSRGLPTLLELVRRGRSGPLDILAADGRGRSYGLTSRLICRSLPSILSSGLWSKLDSDDDLPTDALVTDVGNDILYGVPSATLLSWVEEAFDRLRRVRATIAATALPIASLETLGPTRFTLLRTVLFPGKTLDFETARRRAYEVDEGVRRLAENYAATLVVPRREWYGIDPIHIRPAHWSAAWPEIVSGWKMEPVAEPIRVSFARWFAAQWMRPERRSMFGIDRRTEQPCRTWSDGTQLSLF